MTYFVHILAGTVALVSGYAALYSVKGATLHRRSGSIFVYAMLAMTVFGATIALVAGAAPALNVPVAALTFYLVVTGLTTLRAPSRGSHALDLAMLFLVLGVAVADIAFGLTAIRRGGTLNGIGSPIFFVFGGVALVAGAGDVRMLRGRILKGARRLARHLWRMSFALLVAAMSFFIGQAKVIPEPIRIRPLLAAPVFAVLVTMLYWLWRVRFKQSLRGLVRVRTAETAEKGG